MSENRNRQNIAAADFSRTKTESNKISVLYLLPVELSDEGKHEVLKSISSEYPSEIIEYTSQSVSRFPDKLNKLVSRFSFLARVIERIRKQTHLHIFYLKGSSLIGDILPLFIIGKFFSKKIIFEHKNYNDYYLFDDFNRLKKRLFRFADQIIVPSNNIKHMLTKRRLPAIFRMPTVENQIEDAKIIRDIQPRILVDAHLEEVFNFHCLTKAFLLVKQKYPRTELIIKGAGSLKGLFMKSSQNEKMYGVSFDNSVNYTDADLFINCYHIEHFSEKMIEAMGYGIPVVSTPIGLIDKLTSRKNIMMFQYNDFSTLADHVIELIEKPELTETLSKEGAEFYKSYISSSHNREKPEIYSRIF